MNTYAQPRYQVVECSACHGELLDMWKCDRCRSTGKEIVDLNAKPAVSRGVLHAAILALVVGVLLVLAAGFGG